MMTIVFFVLLIIIMMIITTLLIIIMIPPGVDFREQRRRGRLHLHGNQQVNFNN